MENFITGMLEFSDSYRNIHTQKKYKLLFEEYYERHRPGMDLFNKEYETLEPSAAAELAVRTAALLVEKENERIGKIRRWNRGIALFNDSFFLITFLVPALSHYNQASANELADAVVTRWNSEYPKNKIQRSNYETILSGYGTGTLADLFRFRKD